MEDNRQPPAEGALADAVQTPRKAPVPAGPGPQRNAELLSAIEQAAKQTLVTTLKGRIRMMKRITKMTVAATLLVGLLGLLSWMFPGNGSPALAFADMAEKLAKVRTVTFKAYSGTSSEVHEDAKFLVAPGRMRIEDTNRKLIIIMDFRQLKGLALDPDKKVAWLGDMRDDDFDDVPFFARDWEHPLETLRKEVRDAENRPDGKVERLSAKRILGGTDVGFRFKLKEKKHATKTIWADQETGLPIRIDEIENGIHTGFKDYRFNVELDDSLFDLEPPEGYTVRKIPPGGNSFPPLDFADVAEKLAEIRTATCKVYGRGTEGPEETKWREWATYLMAPGFTRMEFDNGQILIEDHRKKKCIRLNPDKKLANVWDMNQWIDLVDNENPVEELREAVRWIKEGGDVEELGTKQIDGRTAVGFRLKLKGKNQDTDMTIWADPKTGLPIRIEQTITGPGPSVDHSVFKDFRFNVKLDDSLFDVEPPEGYTVRKMPSE